MELRGKNAEQVREALQQAGLPEPDAGEDAAPELSTEEWAAQRADELEGPDPLTAADLEKIFDSLLAALAEASGEPLQEEEVVEESPIEPENEGDAPTTAEKPEQTGPTPAGTIITQLVGSYEGQQGSPDGSSEPMNLTFRAGGPNQLIDQDGDVWTFDPATNTATVYHSAGGLDGTFQITFTIAGRAVTYTGTLTMQGPDGSVYLPLSGTKVG